MFSFSLFFLLFHSVIWSLIFEDVHDPVNSYEDCVSRLSESDWHYDQPIMNQTACISFKPKYSDLPSVCQYSRPFWKLNTLSLTNGFSFDSRLNSKCNFRAFHEREGTKKRWIRTSDDYIIPIKYKSPLTDLFNTLVNNTVDSIMFIGDSVTVQTALMLYCDAHCDRLISKIHHKDKIIAFDDASKYQEVLIANILFSKLRNFPPCIYEACTEDIAYKKSYEHTYNILYKYHNKNKNTIKLFIFNEGLHLYRSNMMSQIVNGTAHALWDFATNTAYSTSNIVFFRESPAQHFNTLSGHYHGQPTFYNNNTHNTHNTHNKQQSSHIPYCCSKAPLPAGITHDIYRTSDILFQHTFQSIDPQWRTHIGWLPFYNDTMAFHDLHLENGFEGAFDCTHYFYIPHMFNMLYIRIRNEFIRLIRDRIVHIH